MTPALLFAAPLLLFAAPATEPSVEAPVEAQEPAPAPPAPPPGNQTAPNAIFAEAFGTGLLYSVNYERFVEKWNVGLRGGVSYFTYAVSTYGSSGNLTIFTVPVVASYYLGWAKHKVQLGLGATLIYTAASSDSRGTSFESERSGLGLAAAAVVGYRYMPQGSGFTFGVGFTPLLRASKFLPWGGASAGYAF